MKKSACLVAVLLSTAMLIGGCDQQAVSAAPQKMTQAQKAADAANSVNFSENAEIDNIKRRLELTSKPGQIGYILLLNDAGQPILYTSVKGKVTSGGKRLTAPVRKWRLDCGQYCGETIAAAPSDEGTWGESGQYVYFWTTDDQYVQWSGQYLYSDQPIRLKVEPLVISVATGK